MPNNVKLFASAMKQTETEKSRATTLESQSYISLPDEEESVHGEGEVGEFDDEEIGKGKTKVKIKAAEETTRRSFQRN